MVFKEEEFKVTVKRTYYNKYSKQTTEELLRELLEVESEYYDFQVIKIEKINET